MALDSTFQYLNDGIHSISNEQFIMPSSNSPVYLKHDNCTSVTVFTGLNSSGVQITGFTVNNDSQRNYRQYLLFDLSTRTTYANQTLYINYTSAGDMVDDQLVQEIRDEVIRVANLVDSQSGGVATIVASTIPNDEAIDVSRTTNIDATFNKWIDDGQENKLKVYSDALRTNEVSGTISKIGNKTLRWTPSVNLNYSSMYYPSVLSGVIGVDGVSLTSPYMWEFQVMAQPANNSPSFSVQPSSAIINTGGCEITYTCSDTEGDTIIHKLKLDAGSFVTLTVGSGVTFGSGTATLTSLGSGQYKITLTNQGWSTSSNHTAVVNISDASNTSGTNSNTVNINVPANTAPTLSVSVVDTTSPGVYAVGDTLTASTTVGTDAEGDTVSSTTWEWLRDDVVITGQTTSTKTVVETDIGKTIKARATVTMSAGSNPSPASSSGITIPVPAAPTVSFSSGDQQLTANWTVNTVLATETYNLYLRAGSNPTTSAYDIKLTNVTPGVIVQYLNQTGQSNGSGTKLTNGTTYYGGLTMVVNGTESALGTVGSGVPSSAPQIPSFAPSNDGRTITRYASNPIATGDIQMTLKEGNYYYGVGMVSGTCKLYRMNSDFTGHAYQRDLFTVSGTGMENGARHPYLFKDTLDGNKFKVVFIGEGSSAGFLVYHAVGGTDITTGTMTVNSTALFTRGTSGYFDTTNVQYPMVYIDGTTYYLYYSGYNTANSSDLATGLASGTSLTSLTKQGKIFDSATYPGEFVLGGIYKHTDNKYYFFLHGGDDTNTTNGLTIFTANTANGASNIKAGTNNFFMTKTGTTHETTTILTPRVFAEGSGYKIMYVSRNSGTYYVCEATMT